MTIALAQLASKEIFFYRMVSGVKTAVSGAAIQAFGESQGGMGAPFTGFTGADGKLTVELMNNAMFYMVSASVSIDGVSYYASSNTNSFAAVPTELELTKSAQ